MKPAPFGNPRFLLRIVGYGVLLQVLLVIALIPAAQSHWSEGRAVFALFLALYIVIHMALARTAVLLGRSWVLYGLVPALFPIVGAVQSYVLLKTVPVPAVLA